MTLEIILFVKYATCTLQDSALTWWNSHKRTIGVDAAYAMNWVGLMKLMTEVYCPRNEIKKMDTEIMVPDEEDIVERFIGGLPDNIQGNVITANPARLQDAVRIANQLMDKKLQGYAAGMTPVGNGHGYFKPVTHTHDTARVRFGLIFRTRGAFGFGYGS
ncbi:hypothetical protein Tco_0296355 [Tanacetum coccineum]